MIDDLAWDNIWPVVTLVGGYALSRVDESRRRSHERLVAEDTRRRGFERDTYIELQDLLPTLQRE
ncbi:MAG TPA: hypothetical protein VK611_29540, partial [Acidimicrobiales bacterium]|nr:hypothetical protein [Acidimicrobiales bacterium]